MDAFRSPYDPKPLRDWAEHQAITTLPQLFADTLRKCADQPFLGHKSGGRYVYQSYREVASLLELFAGALLSLGLQPQDRVAQISNNRPEWVITDLATMSAAGIHVPLYATVSHDAFTYILNDSSAKFLVLETADHLALLRDCQSQLPHLEGVVSLTPFDTSEFSIPVWSWDDFLALGAGDLESHRAVIAERSAALRTTDVCSLVYTSGTTGEPKGAMLMHGNFVSNALSVLPNINIDPGDVELSFLPLSHVFERTLYYLVLSLGATIAYAESMDKVRDNLLEVRPHLIASVPRLYEKIQAGVLQKASNGPNLKRTRAHLFAWALEVGRKHAAARHSGKSVPWGLSLEYKLAYKLVLGAIHAATGGRIKVFASGGAALRADVCDFFLSAGFTLIEGYGLTETSPVITMNPPLRPKVGTVGTPIEHVEVKISSPDGEILSRGPHIMLGYFNKPEATQQVIDDENWFYTGDIGVIDTDGYLRITDRKKEILVLSNGKNVAPSPIEQAIKQSPFIEQVVLLGDNRNFVSALIVPAYERMNPWCTENGVSTDPTQLANDPKAVEFLTQETIQGCQNFSHYEQVKKIAVLPRELSQQDGELTPTLKIKRKIVNQNFRELIEAIYS